MRLLWLSALLALLLLIPFLIFGPDFTAWLSGEAAIERLRSWGPWGGLALIGLLIADLFLPVPSTPLISAAGFLYGLWLGGVLASIGSFLSGLLAYGLCRRFGHQLALRLAGAEDLARGQKLFERRGAWLVALSRSLPLLAEVTACLAGLARMPFWKFSLSLACGCIPMAFVYAGIGAAGQDHPSLALGLSAGVPALLWSLVQWSLRKAGRQ